MEKLKQRMIAFVFTWFYFIRGIDDLFPSSKKNISSIESYADEKKKEEKNSLIDPISTLSSENLSSSWTPSMHIIDGHGWFIDGPSTCEEVCWIDF